VDRLCDLFRHLGDSLNVEENCSTLDRELRRLVAFDAISVHVLENGRLTPAYAAGVDFQTLSSLEVPVGEGLTGRVARTGIPAVNERLEECGSLTMALVVAAEPASVVGLYRCAPPGFSEKDLRIVLALAPKLGATLENSLKYRQAERLAGFDSLTGLPNGRALFQRLDSELARARRLQGRVAVLDCAVEKLTPLEPAWEKVAAALRDSCREYDFAARSGDGFVLVLPGFRPEDFKDKHARLQALARQAGLNMRIGAAFFPEDGADAEDLLARAGDR
jgi:GGDEF domain-containing protein